MTTSEGANGGGARGQASAKKKSDDGDLSLESVPAPLIDLQAAGRVPGSQDPDEKAFEAWIKGAHAHQREAAILASLRVCSRALAPAQPSDAGMELVRRVMPNGPEAQVSAMLCLTAMAFDAAQVNRFRLLLAESLRLMQQSSLLGTALAPPEVMSQLCACALRLQIEPQAAREAILAQRIRPAKEIDSLIWPWAVRLHTLGRFGLVIAGEPLTFKGKSPKKALELLQQLVASGGREVSTEALMQSLWPEESSSNLRNLFDNTLHRLRRLLVDGEALQIQNGKLGLDPQRCWVDAWSFGRLTQGVAVDVQTSSPPLDVENANAALRLYSGHFLATEGDVPWALPYRDRLRNRFHRLVLQLGRRFEGLNAWEAAISIYEQGLEVDNLSELLYQQLMICHLNRGEHAEAMLVYRRCRELLSIVLGVAPSERTEQLHRAAMIAPRH